eukprot:COSAG06_NODE_53214_length_301_cov_0.856436_1_plen_100_part_11
MSANDFNSVHELRVGGNFPGNVSVACRDDPDKSTEQWTNTGMTSEAAYFFVDGFNATEYGWFTLGWSITANSGSGFGSGPGSGSQPAPALPCLAASTSTG